MTVGGGGPAPEQMAGLARSPGEVGQLPGKHMPPSTRTLKSHKLPLRPGLMEQDSPPPDRPLLFSLVYSWSRGQTSLGPGLLTCKMGQS